MDTVQESVKFSNYDDPEERKRARQARLRRRHENAARVKEELEGTLQKKTEKPHLIQTIDESNENLFKIFVGGKVLVTNIRVSSDTREIDRRNDEITARNIRLQQLEDEAALAQEKLDAIMAKWSVIQSINDPLDLSQELKEQRDRCADLIAQKDQMIASLKEELKLADERYVSDRADMWEDVCILSGRINQQVLVMKRSYMQETGNIEAAIDKTRHQLREKNDAHWVELYESREKEEIGGVATYLKMMEMSEEEIKNLHVKHDEEYRDLKIKLETDVQTLEQELERIKAICLVNSEKLDYNYQVLKKREDENVIVKNNQKRTLNKLQDEATRLRRKIEEKDAGMKNELEKLNKEVCRLHENILDIEKKSDYFSKANDKKFLDVLKMKTHEANELIKQINEADQLIHHEILGLKWDKPRAKPLKLEDLVSYKAAQAMIEEIFKTTGAAVESKEEPVTDEQTKCLKAILSLVASNAGFLTEEKIEHLLEPYSSEEKTLVRLDNVFNAIGVRSKEQIDMIFNYFTPYLTCPECPGRKIVTRVEADNQSFCENNHSLLIEKQDVLKGLRDYVTKLHSFKMKEKSEADVRVAKDRCTTSRLISNDDIKRYWESYETVFPEETLVVWDSLYDGMIKYYSVLQDRDKLQAKEASLKNQNSELASLIEKYVSPEPF